MDRQVSSEQAVRDQAEMFQKRGTKLVDRFMEDYNRVAEDRLKYDRETLEDLNAIYGDAVQQVASFEDIDTTDFSSRWQEQQRSLETRLEQIIAACST